MFNGKESLKFLAEKLEHKSYSVTQLYEFEKTYKYTKVIPIGIDDYGKLVYLNFTKSKRMLVLGRSGSGKTFLLQNIMSRYYHGVGAVVILTDLKPEYYLSNKPIQKEFWRYLLKNEKPQGLPIKTFYPYFFTKFVNRKFADNILCQLALQDLSVYDFYTLTGMNELTITQRTGIEESFDKIRIGEVTSLDELKEDIEENSDISSSTKKSLKAKIRILQNSGIIGDEFSDFSFTQEILNGGVPNLNMCGYNKLGGNIGYPTAFLAVVLRKLLADNVERAIPKELSLLFVLDECNKFCPREGNPSSKQEILNCLDLSRIEKVSMLFSTQDFKRIPETVLRQCQQIFIPYTADFSDLKELVKEKASDEYENPISYNMEMAQMLGSMKIHKDGSRDWLLIDTTKKEDNLVIFRPLSPLCFHLQE